MATFQVPQFIEERAKIVGFLTLPQFLYIAGGGVIVVVAFKTLSFFLWLMVSSVTVALAVALAFVKVNGQTFPGILTASLGYLWKPRVYTWQRSIEERTLDVSDIERIRAIRNNMSIQEKLKSVALAISTGKLFSQPEGSVGPNGEQYETVMYLTGEKRLAKHIDY